MSQRLLSRTQELLEARRCGLAPYITAGDGGLRRTRELLFALERSGATCVELGVPFSDPIADGPVLQAAAERGLAAGASLRAILECVSDFRADGGELPIALFSYANPLISGRSADSLPGTPEGRRPAAAVGETPNEEAAEATWNATCERLAVAGVDALLVPDLPVEEGENMARAAHAHDLCPIFFVSPTTSAERLTRAASASRGFLYAIGRTGITGGQTELGEETLAFLRRVREAAEMPVGVGFGLRNAEQVRAVSAHAELAIVGSALVQRAHEAALAHPHDPQQADRAAVEATERYVAELRQGIPS